MSEPTVSTLPQRSFSDPELSNLLVIQEGEAEPSPGALLRQAREAAGLHIAALAASLKVPVKKLEALEADQFELLPDTVFVRALASSVCRTLKIDSTPVLQQLPKNSCPISAYAGPSINTPFRAPGDSVGPSMWAHLSRPAVLAGLALLLGALVLILLPAVKTGLHDARLDSGTGTSSRAVAKAAATVVTAESRSADAQRVSLSIPDLSLPPSAASNTMASPQMPTPSGVTRVEVAAPIVSPVVDNFAPDLTLSKGQASVSSQLPATGIVVFSAKGASWVEVTDSKGQTVLRRTLSAGEVVGASGVLPLVAIVGRADATEVQIRGKAIELSAFAKDNVARFEVK